MGTIFLFWLICSCWEIVSPSVLIYGLPEEVADWNLDSYQVFLTKLRTSERPVYTVIHSKTKMCSAVVNKFWWYVSNWLADISYNPIHAGNIRTLEVTPRQVMTRQVMTRQAKSRQATLSQVTHRQASTMQVMPRQTTPRKATPRQALPQQATSRHRPGWQCPVGCAIKDLWGLCANS